MANENKKTGTPRVKKEPVPGEVTLETKAAEEESAAIETPAETKDESLAVWARNGRCTYKSIMRQQGEKFYLEKEEHFNAKMMVWVIERPRTNRHGKTVNQSGRRFAKDARPGTFRKAMQDLVD